MPSESANGYVETRDGAYYVAGTRVGLDVLIHEFRRGETPEAIFAAYPGLGALSRVYGAITFILENPEAVDRYLQDQDARWKKFADEHPIPGDMLERFRKTQRGLSRRAG